MSKHEMEITLENKMNIADASKRLRAFGRMARSPKTESTSFPQKFLRTLMSSRKKSGKASKKSVFEKTIDSNASFMATPKKLGSEFDESHDRSYTKTVNSDHNISKAQGQVSFLERSMNVEENAQSIANQDVDKNDLDKDIMSLVSEFDTHRSIAIFRPDSTCHMLWDILGFVVIIYQSIIVPYRI
jgi:hypothetical protein